MKIRKQLGFKNVVLTWPRVQANALSCHLYSLNEQHLHNEAHSLWWNELQTSTLTLFLKHLTPSRADWPTGIQAFSRRANIRQGLRCVGCLLYWKRNLNHNAPQMEWWSILLHLHKYCQVFKQNDNRGQRWDTIKRTEQTRQQRKHCTDRASSLFTVLEILEENSKHWIWGGGL